MLRLLPNPPKNIIQKVKKFLEEQFFEISIYEYVCVYFIDKDDSWQVMYFFFFTQEIKKENARTQFSQLFPGETFISLSQPVMAMIIMHPQAALSPILYMHF